MGLGKRRTGWEQNEWHRNWVKCNKQTHVHPHKPTQANTNKTITLCVGCQCNKRGGVREMVDENVSIRMKVRVRVG